MMGALEGRTALVTGGASGIGKAAVERFSSEGASLAVVDLNEKAGKEVAASVGGTFVRADGSDSRQVAQAFAQAKEALGKIDIAYLNAGVTTGQGDIAELTDEQYLRILGINLNGVVFGVREAVRAMTPGGGSILATASLAGLISYPGDPIYALTKHGVVGLARGLGPSLEPRGITFNAICPGIVETPLLGDEAASMLKKADFPLIRPEEIAEACMRAITGGGTGECWVIQPGRDPLPYEFRGVPGPRAEGGVGRVPPGVPQVS
jgi:NAD(P)-dependent dehydrogenase (short-subunit alcohol dehydrogenase family)